ncbi:hypothetical protein LBMAG53_38120 [Planctomycetota bacterium]|nr:hypothetical protein LBMAG53_38120 [Planctomycetota bacterium]
MTNRIALIIAAVGLVLAAGCGRANTTTTTTTTKTSSVETSSKANPEGKTVPLTDKELGK